MGLESNGSLKSMDHGSLMKTDISQRSTSIGAGLILSVALTCGLAPRPAHGIGPIVHDPGQTAKHVAEFKAQLARWKETAAHYRQQLISLRGMDFAATKMDETLIEVSPQYGIKEACQTQDESPVATISEFFKPNADGDILEQQLAICKRIVHAENLKYNETVRFLNNMRKRQQALGSIDQARDAVGSEQGKLQSVNYDLQRYENSTKADHERWSAMIVAYDNYIESLNKFQRRLTDRALKGKQPNVFSAVIQGAVLKKTLNEMRD